MIATTAHSTIMMIWPMTGMPVMAVNHGTSSLMQATIAPMMISQTINCSKNPSVKQAIAFLLHFSNLSKNLINATNMIAPITMVATIAIIVQSIG